MIQVIITMVSDLKGLIVVLAFLIVGFSLIFFEFDRDEDYSNHLFSTYKLLFGEFEDNQLSLSEKLILSFILFILNIAFISLIISIIRESYDRTQEKKILTDSLTRLDMIQEIMLLMRIVRPKKNIERGYLIVCRERSRDGGDGLADNEGEGRDNMIKKLFKQADIKRAREINQTRNDIARTRQEATQNKHNLNQEISNLAKDMAKGKQETKKEINLLREDIEQMKSDTVKLRGELKRGLRNVKVGQEEILNLLKELIPKK